MANTISDNVFYRRFRRYYTYVEPIVTDPVVKSYFSLIASLSLVALFIVFALSPTVATIIGLMKKIDVQRQTIVSMDKKINDLIAAQDDLSRFESSLPALEEALPSYPKIESVVNSIELAATRSAVKIESLDFTPISLLGKNKAIAGKGGEKNKSKFKDKEIELINFSLVVSGNDDNLKIFLTTLEKMPRLIKIDNLSVGNKSKIVSLTGYSLCFIDEPNLLN